MFLYYFTGLVLFLNVSLLTILVPGGPIENRDFDHLKGSVFWGFNIFLISLGLISFVTSYLLMIGNVWAFKVSIIIGIFYLLVYLLDLATIFPKSPTRMSNKLQSMEIINSLVAILLIIISLVAIQSI